MTNMCKDRLEVIVSKGSKNDQKLGNILLNNEIRFKTISDLSTKSGISKSSIHRFAEKLGYQTFKNFTVEYNSEHENEFIAEFYNSKNIDFDDIKVGTEISKKVRGSIHFISSKKTRGVANILSEQLKTINAKHRSFDEGKYDLDEFIKKIPDTDTIILITLSGWSRVISNVITHIAQNPREKYPKIIILTTSKPLKVFSKYEFMEVIVLSDRYNLSNWRGHYEAVIDIIKIGLIVLQKKYKKFE